MRKRGRTFHDHNVAIGFSWVGISDALPRTGRVENCDGQRDGGFLGDGLPAIGAAISSPIGGLAADSAGISSSPTSAMIACVE